MWVIPNICFSHLIWTKGMNPRWTSSSIVWLILSLWSTSPISPTLPVTATVNKQVLLLSRYRRVLGLCLSSDLSLWSSSFFSSSSPPNVLLNCLWMWVHVSFMDWWPVQFVFLPLCWDGNMVWSWLVTHTLCLHWITHNISVMLYINYGLDIRGYPEWV